MLKTSFTGKSRMPKQERRPFQYKERNVDDFKERANRSAGGFDSYIKQEFKRYKVRDGKNHVRILPPTWENASHYGYDIFVNYGIGPDNQSYLSLSKMAQKHPELELDGRDPIAEARRAAEREDEEELVKQLKPRDRVLCWVIDRLAEDEGPQLWDMPFTVDKDFCNLCLDEDTREVIYVDNPKNGYDIRFYKEGKGLNTKYPGAKMKLLGPSPLHEERATQQGWLDYAQEHPVPDCLQLHDYEHISAVFDGKVSRRDDDDAEPVRRPARSPDLDDEEPAPKTGKVVEEDDDEDDAPPKTTAPKAGRKRPVVAEAEDDEDEPADDPPPRQSIRDRLKAARGTPKSEDDE
jgi:hypothetical protein